MKIKKILSVLNLSAQKILILGMVFALTGGAIAYAQFYRSSGPGFGYGYGYGFTDGYGYGYGYNSILDAEGNYGFFGDDGSATFDAEATGRTTIEVTYTTEYTATNTVEYNDEDGVFDESSDPTEEAAGEYTVELTGLDCGTEYDIRVSSEDSGGNTWNNNETTVETDACATPTPPGGGPGGVPVIYSPFGPGSLNNPTGNGGVIQEESFQFLKDLEFDMTDTDVYELQKYLNARGFLVSVTGAGSPNNETNYFGPATRAALAKFQAANGITPAVGYFGPKTRAFINGQSSSQQPQPNPSQFIFTKDLEFDMTDPQVNELQKRLNAVGFIVSVTGAGSPNNETNYFGPATRAALAKFQAANGITPAVGYFGPKTRGFMNGQ